MNEDEPWGDIPDITEEEWREWQEWVVSNMPDDLWQSERSRISGIRDRSANDADWGLDPSQFTIDSIGLKEVLGLLATVCCCAVTALLGVMVGSSITRKMLKRKASGFAPAATRS